MLVRGIVAQSYNGLRLSRGVVSNVRKLSFVHNLFSTHQQEQTSVASVTQTSSKLPKPKILITSEQYTKSWYEKHLLPMLPKHLPNDRPYFYILSNIRQTVFFRRKFLFQKTELRNLSEEILNCDRTLLASGNGLICLRMENREKSDSHLVGNEKKIRKTTDTTITYIVCNPVTGEWISVPVPVPVGQYVEILGLYFHPPSREHRMLLRFTEPSSYVVLTLGPNTMRRINYNPAFDTWKYFDNFVSRSGPVLMNGSLHWFEIESSEGYKLFITIYNLETEQFTHLRAPKDYKLRCTRLVQLGGKLCILNHSIDDDDNFVYDFWVLKDYEKGIWMKKKSGFLKTDHLRWEDDDADEHTYVQVNRDQITGSMVIVKDADCVDIANPLKDINFYSLMHHRSSPKFPDYSDQTIDYCYDETFATISAHNHFQHLFRKID